jgi:broad specificity phosphatase PhoE
VLVRHAMSAVDRSVDSRQWGITPDAIDECVLLASSLPATPADVRSSTERKAVDTAKVIANITSREVQIDERFGEVRRPFTWDDDYRSIAMSYLQSDRDEWEPRTAVVARFTAGVEDALRIEGNGPLVVVNHGLALSLYLASVAEIDVVSFWSALTFPDAWSVDLDSGEKERVFTGGRPPPDG